VSRTARAVSGTATGVASWLLQIAMAAVLAPVVLRYAGQETLGTYAVLMQVIGYLALLDLGIGFGMSRYLPQALGVDDGGRRFREVFSSGRVFQIATNFLSAAIIAVVAVFVGRWFKLSPDTAAQARIALGVLAFWTFARSPISITPSALLAVQDMSFPNIASVITNAVRFGVTIGALMLHYGLVGITVANVLADALQTAACAWRFQRLFPHLRPEWAWPDKSLLRELISFGSQMTLVNLAVRLCLFTDNLVVGSLFGAMTVSVYYSTQLIGNQLWLIVARLPDYAAPAINQLYAHGESRRLGDIMLRLHRYNLLIILPAAVGLLAFNGTTVRLWLGPGQFAGMLLTASLAGFMVLLCVGHVAFIFVTTAGKIRGTSALAVGEGLANLGLSIWLGRRLGAQGVMLATLLANFPTTAYMLWISVREFQVRWRDMVFHSLLPGSAPVVVSGAALFAIIRVVPPVGWASLVGDSIAFCTVHAAAVFLLGLSAADRRATHAVLTARIVSRRRSLTVGELSSEN
jgi:O-antigen/teichoic acid export membrane protein